MKENVVSKEISLGPMMLFEYSYSSFHYPKHFHETYVIELIEKGSENFYWNGKNFYHVPEDSLVLINPGEIHTGAGGSINKENARLECRAFYPTLQEWKNIAGDEAACSHHTNNYCFKSPIVTDKKIAASIRQLYLLSEQPGENLLPKRALYQEIMFDLMSKYMSIPVTFATQDSHHMTAVNRAKEYINDNLGKKLLLEDISRAAYVSPYHFLRIFKHFTGITLHQYIISLRMDRARHLLMNPACSIQEAFHQLGFSNQTHFTKLFRKMSGLTPHQFQQVVKA